MGRARFEAPRRREHPGPGAALLPSRPGCRFVVAPGGRLASEDLVEVDAHGRPPVWLRLDRLDRRDDVLAISIVAAFTVAGRPVPEHLPPPPQRPIAELGRQLGEAAGGPAVVIEDVVAIPLGESVAELARGLVAGDGRVVLVRHRRSWRRPAQLERFPPVVAAEPPLPVGPTGSRHDRLRRLVAGRPAIRRDVDELIGTDDVRHVEDAARSSRRLGRFLHRLTRAALADRSPTELLALEAAAIAGYWTPGRGERDQVDLDHLRPWLVPLEGGSWWLRPCWAGPLRHQLRRVERARPVPAARPGARSPAPVATPDATSLDLGPTQLRAQLLGGFAVTVDGRPVERWIGQRGPMLLKFLLAQPGRTATRDRLLDVFWPDVTPTRARNRLHVALGALRRSISAVTDAAVVEHHDGSYRISGEVEVVLDLEEFDRHASEGGRYERDGDVDAAIAHYDKAVEWYGGPLLPDHPYEEWTVLPRETCRLAYLDLLDRLGALHLDAGRLDQAIAVAQRLVDEDPCHEEAHRLAMRCFALQGRAERAERQFALCARALASRLDVEPSAATVELRDSLRGLGA